MSDNETKTPRKGKKKKRTFSLNRFLKFIILSLLLVILLGGSIGLGTAYAWVKSAAPLNVNELFDLSQTTYIVDKNDKLIDNLHANENRTMVTIDQIPQDLQDAFIAIEDKRFLKHNGIDPYRIIGALKADLKTGELSQGASTITQQLIKNIYLTPDKKWKRKVVEMYYAIQLERRFRKEQILEAYLNTIGLGHNVAGVKAAALYYFGKELDQLTLAECATIAGITRYPSAYSPYINFAKSMERKDLILKEMLGQGFITQSEYDDTSKQEIKLAKVQKEVETTYFSDMIINDVIDTLQKKLGLSKEEAEIKLYNGGLKIIATIDTEMQNMVEATFKNTKLFPESKEDGNGILQPEAAVIIIENGTGEIKAVMGGRSEKVRRGLNRATQSLRQPGSTIKPLAAYAPALDNGYTVGTVIDDAPVAYGNYKPRNYSNNFKGLVTLREGIKHSTNVVAVKIVQDIGIERSLEYLKKFGITTMVTKADNKVTNDEGLSSLALGGVTKGVKPIEMAAAFSVFPNKGILIKPISFTKILDKDGNLIFENKPEKSKVISEQVSYLMVDIMKGVVTGGTGGNAALSKMPVAGKTGTTTTNKDAWFTGYSPYYTTSVWIGHDDPKPMNFTGGSYPAKLWKAVMEEVHKNLKVKDFERPGGLVSVNICTVSGKRPSELCALDPRGSTVKSEIFIKGTEPGPESICDVHVIKDVDVETGKLATPNCPSTLVQSKVFIQRTEPFIPQPDQKQVPADLIYEAPTEFCDKHTEPAIGEDPLEGEEDLEGDENSVEPTPTPTPTNP
ncbi:MAG TPA: PBP1A family penicillin-binding protein [Clostridia bacterium]|nr:PBP1A family penicillin-binding protein [Clostridia bacterium]